MILIGTMNWASTQSKGLFHCPNCSSKEPFRHKTSRPFLTLYFIPVLPIGGLEEYVQCGRCKNAFEPSVLTNHVLPTNAAGQAMGASESLPTFEEDLLTVIALIMIEDGQVSDQEILIGRRLYENMTETNLSRESLGRMCSLVRMRRFTMLSFLSTCAQRRSHAEKLLIVQAMFGVAGAEGEISPGRLQSLMQSQVALQIDESEFQRTVADTSQWLG